MAPIGGVRSGIMSAARDAIPDSGISRYEFEGDSDTSVLVDSWGENNGTLSGASYVTDGVSFDGNDDEGAIPSAAVPTSGSFSVALRAIVSTNGTHFGIRDSDSDSVITIEHDSGEFEVSRFESGTTENIVTTDDYRDGDEHLFVLAEDDGAEVFVDDNSVGTASALSFSISDDFGIGYRGGGGGNDRYSEMIAVDLQTFDKRLTASEVSNLWETGSIDG